MVTTNKKIVTVQYKFIKFITNILAPLKLSDKEGFARRRFLRMFGEFQIDIDSEQKDLRARCCEKDAKGALKVEDGGYVFKNLTARKNFEKEYRALGENTFVFEVSAANEADLKVVKKILNTEITKIEDEKKGEYDAGEYSKLEDLKEFVELLKI